MVFKMNTLITLTFSEAVALDNALTSSQSERVSIGLWESEPDLFDVVIDRLGQLAGVHKRTRAALTL